MRYNYGWIGLAAEKPVHLEPAFHLIISRDTTRGIKMKQIPLTQGKVAIVDDEDYKQLSRHKWYASKNRTMWYATRKKVVNGKVATIRMHRVVLGNIPAGKCVDHKNRNSLDNRRQNLRICLPIQNAGNRNMHRNNTSGYTGVWWDKTNKKWVAGIGVNGKMQFLGCFLEKLDAARAYDIAARKLRRNAQSLFERS